MFLVSLSQLRNDARVRSDTVGQSSNPTDANVNEFLNDSLGELYDVLVSTNQYYAPSGSLGMPTASFTTAIGQSLYPLPNDFYQELYLDCVYSPTNIVDVSRYEILERNKYNNGFPLVLGAAPFGVAFQYEIIGNAISLIPINNVASGLNLVLTYYKILPQLVNDADQADLVNPSWRQFVVTSTAIKIKDTQQFDTTVLLAEQEKLEKRIRSMARMRHRSIAKRAISPFRGPVDPWRGPSGGY